MTTSGKKRTFIGQLRFSGYEYRVIDKSKLVAVLPPMDDGFGMVGKQWLSELAGGYGGEVHFVVCGGVAVLGVVYFQKKEVKS